ncbi:MAG: hypothetical protein IID44_07210 [Planctomycetes bacterium]|nr:hypothetical protein [Planctomycetota bacterium]
MAARLGSLRGQAQEISRSVADGVSGCAIRAVEPALAFVRDSFCSGFAKRPVGFGESPYPKITFQPESSNFTGLEFMTDSPAIFHEDITAAIDQLAYAESRDVDPSFVSSRGKVLTERKELIDAATEKLPNFRSRATGMGLTIKTGRHNPRRGNQIVMTFHLSREIIKKLWPESKLRHFAAGQWWPSSGALVVNGRKVDGTADADEVLDRISFAFGLEHQHLDRKVSRVDNASKHGQTPQAKHPSALRTVENGARPSASGDGTNANDAGTSDVGATANIARRKASEAETAEEASRQQRQRDSMGGEATPARETTSAHTHPRRGKMRQRLTRPPKTESSADHDNPATK